MLVHEQVSKLHSMTKKNFEASFRAERAARMLTDADELNTYLQSGFNHFTTHFDEAFNFMQSPYGAILSQTILTDLSNWNQENST